MRRDADGAPLVAAGPMFTTLGGVITQRGPWAKGVVPGQSFQFLVGTPYFRVGDETLVLPSPISRLDDTLYLPLQFLSEVLPGRLAKRYHYDGPRALLTEIDDGGATTTATLPNGLLPGHLVTIDPGHGGRDPGMSSRYFPKGVTEKTIALQIGLRLRQELQRRGISVIMTRATDTYPPLLERAPMCGEGCDLFLSLHVDALPKTRRNYRTVRGFHTIIIGEESSADAARIARMENDALRYEVTDDGQPNTDALDFIFKDLQMNEYLIESAQLASTIQQHVDSVHGGENRGVHQYNRLAVLNTATRPAALVEMGYGTNRQDAAFLLSEAGQQKLARALADAVVDYLRAYDHKTGAAASLGAGR